MAACQRQLCVISEQVPGHACHMADVQAGSVCLGATQPATVLHCGWRGCAGLSAPTFVHACADGGRAMPAGGTSRGGGADSE